MKQRELTNLFCQSAKAAEGQPQTDYWDAGCKGLALRVSSTGSKTWTFVFGWGNKRHRMRLGTYPATGLKRAHTLADEARRDLEAGRDPRAAKGETLQTVYEEWSRREGSSLRTAADRKKRLDRLLKDSDLAERPIGDIRRSDIVRFLDRIADESGPAAADQALAFLRRVFNWHASRSDDFRSPIVRGMARTKPIERARARVLSDDELRVVWKVAEGQGAFGRLVRFLLITGARRTEAAAMPWAELNGADWTLPKARNKAKFDLLRPLPKAALDVIGAKPDGAAFVFSTDGGHTSISGYSKLKTEFDRAVTAELRKTDPEAKPLPGYTLHDLRRTARSLMTRAGVPSDHAERCLGHVIGGVRATYDRHDFRDEKAKAYEALERQVTFIVRRRIMSIRLVRRDATGSDAVPAT